MQNKLLHDLLCLQLKSGMEVDISVTGVSMEPSLYEGDTVTVKQAKSYELGDTLVFLYKNNELLIHRLLRVKDQRYFCKGDNAFRLEDVEYEQILGKAVKRNGEDIPQCH